ncbi:uncharacterized protein F54H12.2-like [Tachysurus ichikawai]
MAFLHGLSAECTKSELDIFTLHYTQTSIKKYTYIEIPPLSALTDIGPLEFFVAGNGEDYLDLNNTFIHVACKIVNADGTNIANDAKVGVVNPPTASLFSQVDVMLGDRLISQSTVAIHTRTEQFLNVSLTMGRTPWKHNFVQHYSTKTQRDIWMPLTQQIAMKEGNINFALKILNASLFVKKVSVSPSVKLGHAHALLSATAKYSLERVSMKTFSLAAGSRICSQENLFLGPLTKTIIFGIVDNDAFSGSYNKNPFNFKHYDAEFVALYVDGKQLKDQALAINREEYSRGYTLFASNLNPDDDCGQHQSLIKSENMRMEFRFRPPLQRTVNLIVYASFDSILEINNRRNVLIDYQ